MSADLIQVVEEVVVDGNASLLDTLDTTVEESPLSKWEREHADLLLEKAKKSSEAHKKMLADAKNDMDEFYKEREKRVDARKKQNIAAEQEFLAGQEKTMTTGSVWEQVSILVDFGTSKVKDQPTADTARMRSLLIDLKKPAVQ